MAQSEDTELRDLVIESLEKNGSLAKVRALLRANVFLAFEDECENLKQNDSLDKILKLPEGKISLCVIHEFLQFCNLKNTLFVYTAETRQGKEYNYENVTAEKLNVPKLGSNKEPVLITILKDYMKRSHKQNKSNVKDENCTYIVNEDTSTTSSQSLSDSSSDEKNKIDLRLTLHTNSDTDTSSDSAKDKSKSEYIPNQQYYPKEVTNDNKNTSQGGQILSTQQPPTNTCNMYNKSDKGIPHGTTFFNNSSTDSTSYMELKPLNALDEVLHNTSGLPDESEYLSKTFLQPASSGSQNDSISSMKGLSRNSEELNKDSIHETPTKSFKNKSDEQSKDTDTIEYSYDFSPQNSDPKKFSDKNECSESLHLKSDKKSDQQHSPSSHSSVSLSDVADLISEKNNSPSYKINDMTDVSNKSRESSKSNKQMNKEQVKSGISDDSGDFSESTIPSLSNLSLDIHSE